MKRVAVRLIACTVVCLGLLPPSLHAESAKPTIAFSGEVERGQEYEHALSERLRFVLAPHEYGWTIHVRDSERPNEDLARLTPPWHHVPNPRFIEGWHFRNKDNTAPNDGSVNAPQHERDFVFSPQVGVSIDYPPTPEQLDRIRADGCGVLTIRQMRLGNLVPGRRAHIEWMRFDVRCSGKLIEALLSEADANPDSRAR